MARIARRDLLLAGAAAAACASLPRWVGTARADAPPRNLILVLNTGGWDTTYTLDPKVGVAGIDGAAGTVQSFGNIPVLTDPSRPNVAAFFQRYAPISAVVNGIQVRSFIHPDCTKRVLTGTPSDQNPDLGAITAWENGRDLPVPYLVLGSSALSGPLAPIVGRAGMTNQIRSLLSPSAAYPDPGSYVPAPGFVPSATDESIVKRFLDASAERMRSTRGQGKSNAAQIDAFEKSLDRAGLLRAFALKNGGFGMQAYTPDLGVQIGVGTSALQAGLSYAVMMETSGWDTHANDTQQSKLADDLYKGLLTLGQGLEAQKLLDNTVVFVLSEMGRTPKLNSAGGKDHWPVTSALVFGAGVAGGRVFGGTDNLLGAQSVDFATGAVDTANGLQLQTSNLVAGVLGLVGVDASSYLPGVEAFHALGA
jgi:hypothetical protein